MPTSILREEVQRLLSKEHGQLVEVLPAREYADEHIAGAIHIPLKELDAATATQLDPRRPVIVYCHDAL